MKTILVSVFVIFAACPGVAQSEAIQEALTYLNRVRANPDAFSEEIGVPLHNAAPRHALKWDPHDQSTRDAPCLLTFFGLPHPNADPT